LRNVADDGYGDHDDSSDRAGSVMVVEISKRMELAMTDVTFGVTWGQQGYSSASYPDRLASGAQRMGALVENTGRKSVHDGSRGNLVEIIFSPVSRMAAKPLKKMVGATGIEPVTPTMSR
jgi:hypothetical protein